MEIKGDLRVRRLIDADRRVNQGMTTPAVLTAELTLDDIAYWWYRVATDDNGPQDVRLPDATTVPNGWQVVVQNSGNVDAIDVINQTAGTTLKTIAAGSSLAYAFTLLDNSTADGVWHINFLEDSSTVVAARYTASFNATTDWGTAASRYYSQTIAAATHGRGANPVVQFSELSGTDYIYVQPDRWLINSANALIFRVPEHPDCRFAGKVVMV